MIELNRSVILETYQQKLLAEIVQADRKLPRNKREPFCLIVTESGESWLMHHGFAGGTRDAYKGDILALANQELLTLRSTSPTMFFDVSPVGFKYCDEVVMKSAGAQSSEDALQKSFVRVKILLLAANPRQTTSLRIDEEVREIDEAIQKSKHRDVFDIEQQGSVRVSDIQAHLLRHNPTIVHFSGHGTESSEIVLEDSEGFSNAVPSDALSELFLQFKDTVKLVVLNACYSEVQAKAIAEHIDCVVGMSRAVGDAAAISFAKSFYQALGYGKDVETAFELGRNQMNLQRLDDINVPHLVCLRRNPKDVRFIREQS